MKYSIELTGADALIRVLSNGANAVPALARGLYEEGAIIFAESQKQVPHDTGVLMSSGMLHQPAVSGGEVLVEITYGGAAAGYALEQHENMKFKHDPGRKAKYLEDPVLEHAKDFDTALANRVEAIMRGLI